MAPLDLPTPPGEPASSTVPLAPLAAKAAALCALVAEGGATPAALLAALAAAGPLGDDALVELGRRGLLERLAPTAPSEENAALVAALVAAARTPPSQLALASALSRRGLDYDALGVDRLLLAADGDRLLPSLLAGLCAAGLYDPLCALLTRDGTADSASLRALAAARPDYGVAPRNAATAATVRAGSATLGRTFAYDVLIVPGYTPLDATRPLRLRDVRGAMMRVALAYTEFLDGRAPFVLLSGGCVHPAGTPWNEGVMMADELVSKGVPADRLLIDPWARHSTTNLRNAGRMMLDLGLARGLIVSGFETDTWLASQAFYFGHPTLSTFYTRCRETLGYQVGDLDGIDEHRVAFTPAPEVRTPDYRDPLDV